MSIAAISDVWKNSQQSGSKLLLMLALADYADENGESYPSIGRLATKCRCSKTYVKRMLGELATGGELSIGVGQGINTKRGPTNRYTLHLSNETIVTPSEHGGNSSIPVEGNSSYPVRGNNGSPRTVSNNHQVEPSDKRQQHASASDEPEPQTETATTSSSSSDSILSSSDLPVLETTTPLPTVEVDPALAQVVAHYEKEIGIITESMGEKLGAAVKEFPVEWIADAFDIAVENNKRKWSYVKGILSNWKVEGRGGTSQKAQRRETKRVYQERIEPDPSYYEPIVSPVPEVFIDVARGIKEMESWHFEIDDDAQEVHISTRYDPKVASHKFARHIELALKIDPTYCGYAYDFQNGDEPCQN